MKQILFILFSLVGALNASPINFDTKAQVLPAGIAGTVADSAPSYGLNSVTSTVAGSFIDLSATGSIYACITGTAGTSPIVQVQWSNTNTGSAVFNSTYQLGSGCWPVRAAGRYVRFISTGTSLTAKTSLNYYVVNGPAVSVSGSVSSANMVSWSMVSHTTRVINAPVTLNLTATAGSTGVMKWQFGASNSASSGFYWTQEQSATWFPPRNFYSVTTTPLQDLNLAAGTHLMLSPASATDISCTAEIIIWKAVLVVP